MTHALHRYFRRLQKRYSPHSQAQEPLQRSEPTERLESSNSKEEQNGTESRDLNERPASLETPVTCINLLRCNMQVLCLASTLVKYAVWWVRCISVPSGAI